MTPALQKLLEKSKQLREAANKDTVPDSDKVLNHEWFSGEVSEAKDRIIEVLVDAVRFAEEQFHYAQGKTNIELCHDELIAGKYEMKEALAQADKIAEEALK